MRRPLFQIHLSTAIILMFVAGGILWANMRGYKPGGFWEAGWPALAYLRSPQDAKGDEPRYVFVNEGAQSLGMITDAVAAAAVLITAAFLCELFARKPRPRLKPRPLTAAILVLAAALLAWANSRSRGVSKITYQAAGYTLGPNEKRAYEGLVSNRGWPTCFYHRQQVPSFSGEGLTDNVKWHIPSLLTDLFVALCLLISLAVLSELLLRRFFPHPPHDG